LVSTEFGGKTAVLPMGSRPAIAALGVGDVPLLPEG